MADYRLSKRAAADLLRISDYSVDRFGVDQAELYVGSLIQAFENLAAHPSIGTDCGRLRRGVRRIEQGSHVLYYRVSKREILILRILGADQDPYRHL